jgi:hypothetical protein
MDATLTKPKGTSQFSHLVRAARFIAPGLITILIGWGTVQFTAGRNSKRLDDVEEGLKQTLTRQEFQTWANEQREMLRSTNQKADQLMTREEFRTFADQNRDRFSELKEDLRTMKRR